MEKYLNTPIKEVITQFPQIADILNGYNIGCVPCNVGSCLLKDIVEIHNLSIEQEQKLLAKIAEAIYLGKKVAIPQIKRKPSLKAGQLKYSPPIKKLVDEHVLIKRWIALVPEVIKNLDLESEEGKQIIINGLDFIRSYADKFHHAKEEEILFQYFDKNLDIIKTMLVDHETGRSHVRTIVEALQKNDKSAISEHLNGYKDLLTEHIKKEDEILYPWMERNLSIRQVGELFNKFNAADQKIGEVVPQRCEKFIKSLEEMMLSENQKEQKLQKKKEAIK